MANFKIILSQILAIIAHRNKEFCVQIAKIAPNKSGTDFNQLRF